MCVWCFAIFKRDSKEKLAIKSISNLNNIPKMYHSVKMLSPQVNGFLVLQAALEEQTETLRKSLSEVTEDRDGQKKEVERLRSDLSSEVEERKKVSNVPLPSDDVCCKTRVLHPFQTIWKIIFNFSLLFPSFYLSVTDTCTINCLHI